MNEWVNKLTECALIRWMRQRHDYFVDLRDSFFFFSFLLNLYVNLCAYLCTYVSVEWPDNMRRKTANWWTVDLLRHEYEVNGTTAQETCICTMIVLNFHAIHRIRHYIHSSRRFFCIIWKCNVSECVCVVYKESRTYTQENASFNIRSPKYKR